MDLRILRYFLTVADEGSITKAAARLHVSQPALSMQLAALEDELGHKLFERCARGIALTEKGSALKRRADDLVDLADRTEAEQYRNCDILITRDQALPLAENEFYIADLIGLSVCSDDGEELGKLEDVMQTGANDVYVVTGGRHGEILIPAIPDCRIRTDLEAGVITVHLIPGLIDDGGK